MPALCCYRRLLTAALSGCCWLLLLATGSAQFDFQSGSLIEGETVNRASYNTPTTQPMEPLPPTYAAPFAPEQLGPATPPDWIAAPSEPADFDYHFGGQARGYYLDDQRLEFTGMEATFAVEGVLEGGVVQRTEGWEFSLETQLFLNQPFDRNKLGDTPERRSFGANFDVDPLQISQLYLGARHGDFYAALGRFVTPFGRFYFPNYRNNFDDSPFIRSEAILFRETGLLLQWDPSIWVLNAALTNGGSGQDTNSSKAVVARVGIDQPDYALGASVKWQDGIGSESQKAFNNHAGIDALVRRGRWTLSGEAIYDQYGLRRPGTRLNSITWGRSLYYRDLNGGGLNVPIEGFGYYINLGYDGPLWSFSLNYGDFYPGQVAGWPQQNIANHRGLIKVSRHWTSHFESYAVALVENNLADAFDNSTRQGLYWIVGSQFTW